MIDKKKILSHIFFREVGTLIRDEYRTHIFTKGLDINDKKFKGYSTNGSKWVTMNVKKSFKQSAPKKGYSYKEAKEGKMFKRQDDQFSNKTSPVLSGDLYGDFGTVYETSPTGFKMGWSSQGEKVEWLKGMGRVLSTKEQALPKAVAKLLEKETDKFINNNYFGDDTKVIHKIG